MEINLATPNAPQGANSAPAAVRDAAVKQKSDFQPSETAIAKNEKVDVRLTDDERYAKLKRSAQSYFKEVYAVSDSTFSIFKDASGQFITRMTSLRDGSVKYIPEPDVLSHLASRKAEREALLEIEA